MLGALGYSAYQFANTLGVPPNTPPKVIEEIGKPFTAAAASRGAMFVIALAVIAPLVMGAWFAALKIANVRNPSNFYLRSLGLASLPVIALAVASAIPALATYTMAIGAACVPIAYLLLQFIHAQSPMVAGITTGIATLLAALGLYVGISTSDGVESAMAGSYKETAKQRTLAFNEQKKKDDAAAAEKALVRKQESAAADTNVAAEADVKALQPKVDAFKTLLANKEQTREKLGLSLEALIAEVDKAKAAYPDRAEFGAMATTLAGCREQVAAFPSAQPPADLAEAPPAGADWSTKPGRREVSVANFNLTPPLEGLIDFDAPQNAMSWTIGEGKIKLLVEPTIAVLPNQQRPWIAPAFVVSAANNAAVAVTADGQPTVDYGTINGLQASKISVADSKLVYTVHKGDTWLRCSIWPATAGDAGVQAAIQSVRSIRQRADGEPALDPMPAADLIARFQTDSSVTDKVVALLKNKPNAEEAVLKAMGFAPEDPTVLKFGPLIVATGSEKSAPLLTRLAAAGTTLGDQARERLRAIDPKTNDDLAFALLDIKSGNAQQTKKALAALAFTDVDPARQAAVSRALQVSVENGSFFSGGTPETQEAVLTKWLDKDVAKKLQTILETENGGTPASRKVAIRVLGSTQDKKYAWPICRWILDETATVQQTLIAMGPNAEVDVGKLLGDTRPAARKAALEVLDEIATMRSFTVLQQCATRWSGDAETRDHAKAIMQKIREKTPAPKPGPAATPPAGAPAAR
ncbi:MAG: hypothetical protein QM754_21365 [Tepidisphaeraceae bacterium]